METQPVRVTRESGFFTDGRIENTHIEWLIDTGCTPTIIASRVYNRLSADNRPELKEYRGILLSADDSTIKVLGRAEMNVQIGRKVMRHPILVADIGNEGLIGTDFLRTHKMVLDFADNKVICEGELLVARCKEGNNRACRVSVSETVIVPAGTRTVIEGKAVKPLASGSWMVEPLFRENKDRKVMTARALIQGMGTRMPIEVMNPCEEDVVLYKHTQLGIVTRVVEPAVLCTITEGDPSGQKLPSLTPELPPELSVMLDQVEVEVTREQKQQIEQLLKENQEVFSLSGQPLGRTELVQHEIKTGNETPIKQHVRRPPFHLKSAAEAEVQKMLQNDIIEPSDSPWASPVVLVRKKDGTLRYCIDYRKLNAVTRKDSYPLPRIDDSLDALSKAQYFSTLDLASGYWQIGLSEEAKEKSAFCTPGGLYQFKVMPFGLTNAPATFQRLMERVLAGLQWEICLVYIDDVIIFSQTVEQHLDQLEAVFKRLISAGLKLKPKKCNLFRRKVQYLGHVVSDQGIQTDPDKIKAIKDWPNPCTVKEIRSFLGLCSYYRRFVPDFATIARPLIKLTEKNEEFIWTNDQEQAWEELKKRLTSAPILTYPDPDEEFILDTDASDQGIGAVLSQTINGEEKVIAYGSRVLTKQEKRYCVTRKELLAVVHFVKAYRHYLVGRKFTLRTDHASLRWLRSFKEPEGQVARWLETLDTYDFDLVHRPGKKHINADALSRGPCMQCGGDHGGEKIRTGRKPRAEQAKAVVTRRGKKQSDRYPVSNWLSSENLNLEKFKEAQQADPALSEVCTWIEEGRRPDITELSSKGRELKYWWGQYPSLEVVSGVLVRKLPDTGLGPKVQILVPGCLREIVMKECHESLTSGHLGRSKTLANVKRRFLWIGMRKQVEIFVKMCTVCQQFKSSGQSRKAALKDYRKGEPMERVCIDIVGPFPVSGRGNKYALVVTDWFTKYVEIYPMPNQEAETVAQALTREYFSRYGVPLELHSDQGTQFESRLFQEICHLLGIHKTRTTPFRPQSDGISERNIKTLTKMMAMVTKEQEQWDEYLPFISMAYRATPHESTGFSPNFLMYGRELFMPVDVMLSLPPGEKGTPEQYACKLRKQLEYAYDLARVSLKRMAERQGRLYNRGTFGDRIQVGDVVWYANKLRKKGVSPKLQPKWRGPCLVTCMHNDILAQVQLSSRKTTTVHTDLLKPCFIKNLPGWIKRARKKLT